MKRSLATSTQDSTGKMQKDQIDRALSREDEILPSSGFVFSVMDAVRREVAAPPPIPFPWKRALPCLALVGLALVLTLAGGIVAAVQSWQGSAPPLSESMPSVMPSLFSGGIESAVAWVVLSLLVALVSVKLSMSLGSSRA
jgi:hypothetical protein